MCWGFLSVVFCLALILILLLFGRINWTIQLSDEILDFNTEIRKEKINNLRVRVAVGSFFSPSLSPPSLSFSPLSLFLSFDFIFIHLGIAFYIFFSFWISLTLRFFEWNAYLHLHCTGCRSLMKICISEDFFLVVVAVVISTATLLFLFGIVLTVPQRIENKQFWTQLDST